MKPELAGAIKIFITELSTHLDFLSNKATDPNGHTSADSEKLRHAIEHRFHVIRGGAGFFMLDSIRDAATVGEQTFKAATDPLKLSAALNDTLPKCVATLKDEYKKLAESLIG